MIMSNPAKVAKNQRINIVAKCLIGECRLLYKKKTNMAVLGKVIINHSEVENHRRLSSCNKPEPCIIINMGMGKWQTFLYSVCGTGGVCCYCINKREHVYLYCAVVMKVATAVV